jgi:CMP-N,N'-diacetyllegionaminic acid synthase
LIDGKKILAIIPARGGSKRLPRKNVLPLAGKPLIAWTIEAAQKSKYLDEIHISTDDQEIADVSKLFDQKVPELRPESLSTDTATTQSVLFYTLEKYAENSHIVVLLQPTSPLRTYQHIDEAIELLIKKEAYSVVSVTPCEHPPEWSNTLPNDHSMKNFIGPNCIKRSQEFDKSYRLNGAIYVYDINKLINYGNISLRNDSYAYVMPNELSIDIDNQIDLDMAEFFINKKLING